MKKLYTTLLLAALPAFAWAQDFKISADYRARFEHRQGFGSLRPANDNDDRAANLVAQRARISMFFMDKSNRLTMNIAVQDVRTWGGTPLVTTGPSNFMLHEAWAEYKLLPQLSMKVGRQTLSYDDDRILGSLDWAMSARTHDAFLLKYEGNFNLHAGAALSSDKETLYFAPETINNYKAMQFVHFNKKWEKLNLSALFLNNGIERKKDPAANFAQNFETQYSQTIGTRAEYRNGALGLNGAFYYQGGKDGRSNKAISAYNALAEVSYAFSPKFSLLGGYELLSGTHQNETDGKNHSFNPFYGTNHKFNGFMDYFYVGGRHDNNVGLNDVYLTAAYKEGKFNAALTAHMFSTAATVLDAEKNAMGNNLGTELDLTFGYKLNDVVALQGGWSAMFGSETLETLRPATDAGKFNNWGWMSLIVKPTFLNISK